MTKKVLLLAADPSGATKRLLWQRAYNIQSRFGIISPSHALISSELLQEITQFLVPLEVFKSENQRRALFLTAGLGNLLPQIELAGSANQFVPLLINYLLQYGLLEDKEPAIYAFLRGIARTCGYERQQLIRKFVKRLLQHHERSFINSQSSDASFLLSFEVLWANCPQDIQKAFIEFQPNIVHFVGKQEHDIEQKYFVELFTFAKEPIECVIFDWCYSEIQMKSISGHVDSIIGLPQIVKENIIIDFELKFYKKLQEGKSFKEAYYSAFNAFPIDAIRKNIKPILSMKDTIMYEKIEQVLSFYRKANEYYKGNEFETAKIFLLDAIEIDQNHGDSLILLGKAYLRTDEFDKAIKMFNQARPYAPTEYEDLIFQVKKQPTFKNIDNPYSGTLTQQLAQGNTSMFYGRKDTISKLREALIDDNEHLMILYGQRKMGKTCLLKYIQQKAYFEPELHVAFIDIQGVSSDIDLCHKLLIEVKKFIPSNESIPDTLNSFDEFILLFDKFSNKSDKPMLFMLDEFENVTAQNFTYSLVKDADDFLKKMRSIIQHHSKLRFALAGADGLRKMVTNYHNPFFNAGRTFHISFLNERDAEDLIVKPLKNEVNYNIDAITLIKNMTNNHPFYIQLLCHRIVSLLKRKRSNNVKINEVQEILKELTDRKEPNADFEYIWDITPKEAHVILTILVEEQKNIEKQRKENEQEKFSLEKEQGRYEWIALKHMKDRIQKVMTEQNIKISEDTVDDAVQDLLEKDILVESPSKYEYSIPMGLLRQWILNYKPLKKVWREFA